MTDKELDAELVSQVQAGDREAFNLLVSKYRGKLLRVVQRFVHDASDAEDVVQDSFVRAFRALHSFRGDAAFYTWLFRIAVNCAKNFGVSRNRRACVSVQLDAVEGDPVVAEPAVAHADCPMTCLENKQTLNALSVVLQDMPPQLSAPLVLLELEGLTYLEIAEVMHCPIGTVRSRIFRARELVAQKLLPFIGKHRKLSR